MAEGEAVSNAQPDIAQPDKEPRRKSVGGRIARWVLGAVLVFGLLVAGLVLGLNTSVGKRWLVEQIADLEPQTGLQIDIGRIDGNIYGDMVLHDLTLSDPQGVFLTVPRTEIEWRPLSWLSSGLDVRSLTARRGELKRLPELNPGDPDAPTLPNFDISIDQLELEDFVLAPGIAGDERRRVNLVGSADIRDGRAMVKADGRFGEGDRLVVDLTAEPDGDVFDADVRIDAPAGGVITSLADLDGDYRARLAGDGTWSNWAGNLLVDRDDSRIAQLRLTAEDGTFGIAGRADTSPFLSGIPQRALGPDTRIEARGTLVDRVLDGKLELIGQGLGLVAEGAADLANNRADSIRFAADLRDHQVGRERVR